MSDPLSTAASLATMLQLAATATQYLKDVKHGSADRMRLRDELRNTTCLLEMLKDRVEDSEYSDEESLKPASLSTLVAPDGPLELFKTILEDIVRKLAPQKGIRKVAQPFSWPFDKKTIAEMLGTLERLKMHFGLIMQNDLVALAKMSYAMLGEVGKQVDSIETKRQHEETEKILAWISQMNFRSKHADVLEAVQPGTGKWLLEDKVFLDWVNGDVDILWCPGIPGSGKTSLVSLVVDHLHTKQDRMLTYFYCEYGQRTAQTPIALLSSLLEQVLRRAPSDILPPQVSSLYDLHKKHDTRPTLSQITDVVRDILSSHQVVHVVVDALDECTQSEETALEFISAVQALGPNIRLLCTSRYSTTFDTFFGQATRLEISAQGEDIRMFLEAQIPQQSRLYRHIQADPTLKEEIIKTIIEQSRGMFLLATLHFESLSRKLNRREVRSSLQTLPKTLNDTYEQALVRIRGQGEEDVELAETVVLWILCAQRTLTVLELQHMYAMKSLAGEGLALEDDDLPDGESLTSVCRGLVVVDAKSKLIRLVHYTAQQYFQRVHEDRLPSTKLEMTQLSLAYLTLPNFSSGICHSDGTMCTRLGRYPFLDYAAHHWGSEGSSVDYGLLWDDLISFVSNQKAVDVANQIWSLPQHRHSEWSQEFPRDVPALVLAASFDLPNVLRRLVAQGYALESKGSDHETPIIRAASLGNTSNVAVLLELGAAVNASSIAEETALERAAVSGNATTVRALLDGGADLHFKASADWTVLMSAVSSGNIEVVRMLVDAGADLLAKTAWGDSALSIAARNGQENIATYLADRGAILPDSVAGRRASVVAARKGLRTLVRRLTADYTAVAMRGLERQRTYAHVDLNSVPEDAMPSSPLLDNEADRDELTESNGIEDLSEAVDGLDYNRGFLRRYLVMERLGKGHAAEVLLCKSKVTGVYYAAKCFTFTTRSSGRTFVHGIRKEIDSLNELRHENIIRLVDIVVQDAMDKIYLVIELAREGDLINWIVMKQKLTEAETRKLFLQLFSALDFMHESGWVHRDIKPENVMLADKELSIKLADFNLATKVRDTPLTEGLCTTLCGTPGYVAPEVIQNSESRKYSYAVDVWSAGVVMYICLCGFPPFSDELYSEENPYTMADQIKMGKFDYPSPYWDPVGDPALDLIDWMLTVDAQERFTIKQCLQHPWMMAGNGAID
ncbi:unnamed protein product [Periconia digitata]|uniref:Protein kinase domain-containing protein n=1 Tax=Periconia digitata TaxID=1303443 RepID=A0A9W4UTL4_9PLEO|nr:unnamed protein product [Periconia digitata]